MLWTDIILSFWIRWWPKYFNSNAWRSRTHDGDKLGSNYVLGPVIHRYLPLHCNQHRGQRSSVCGSWRLQKWAVTLFILNLDFYMRSSIWRLGYFKVLHTNSFKTQQIKDEMKYGQISYCAVFCLWVYVIKMAVRVSAKFLIKICVLLHPFPQWDELYLKSFFEVILFNFSDDLKQLISKPMQFLKISLIRG